jgi:hypothetical protein
MYDHHDHYGYDHGYGYGAAAVIIVIIIIIIIIALFAGLNNGAGLFRLGGASDDEAKVSVNRADLARLCNQS